VQDSTREVLVLHTFADEESKFRINSISLRTVNVSDPLAECQEQFK